ncbi:hypothetical protein [Salinimicrobium gaetbulicola]|uniref:Uncharacterized protein n=1 Tax=Salinimicrobium gaetbulicola TaxID=999702 RepID=A0ABW3IGT6_9FLAO
MKINRITFIFSTIVLLLMVPLLAMQFTNEVNWTLSDFVIAGILLSVTGLAIELVLRNVKTTKNRLIFCGIVLLVFLVIWAELAVGIFGSPFAGS